MQKVLKYDSICLTLNMSVAKQWFSIEGKVEWHKLALHVDRQYNIFIMKMIKNPA